MMLSIQRDGKKEGGAICSGVCLPKSQLTCELVLFSWRWLSTCLPMGSGEGIPCFALLVCLAFALPKRSVPQFMNFLTFSLLILFPIPWGASELAVVDVWGLVAS